MPVSTSRTKPDRNRVPIYALVTLLGVSFATWWSLRSPVTLDQEHYAITIALYRVCNQQSIEGLGEIENIWREAAKEPSDSRSRQAIATIIAEAKSLNWKDATIDCRQLLEDQVNR